MELAGGVRLVGSGEYPTGVFGMDFSQPPYRWETGAFQASINFAFKKSVFFADFVTICLGSSITSFNSSPNTTQVQKRLGSFRYQKRLSDTQRHSTHFS